jgi:hypothetical protein
MSKLDLSGTGKATDHEITTTAIEIFDILRAMDSPKDASSTILYANWLLIQAAFPPGNSIEAIAAIDAEADLLRQFVREGYQ